MALLHPAPPTVGMRQGTPAEVPVGPVARVIVPPTALLTRSAARGPSWMPIPFISVIDVVGLAAIGAAVLLAAIVAAAPLAAGIIRARSRRYRLPGAGGAAAGAAASPLARQRPNHDAYGTGRAGSATGPALPQAQS